ncbi:MAG: carboxymuconolactone decarboxylase family protein [Promethearchaeota archaeon]
MDNKDKEKIEKIIKERNYANNFFLKKSNVYKSFINLELKTYSDGALKKKYKELIAIGISIVLNCESCIQWHVNEALNSGATKEEILEAIEVGIEMGGGPATVSSRFALKVLEYYNQFDSIQ